MGAIQTTLELVRQKLNEFFRNADPKEDDWVILSNIVDHEGHPYEPAKDKVVMCLANIQYETAISTYNRTTPVKGDQYAIVAPPLYIDLYVLFLANFYNKNYPEGLGMISRTISFFQQNPWFTHDNLPGLDPVIDKLTFEMTNLEVTGLNYLMGLMGAKYLPSAFYKVRMIPFAGEAIQGQVPAAQGVQSPGEIDDKPIKDATPLAAAATAAEEEDDDDED
jgi:Pvc16 N-terminal domain